MVPFNLSGGTTRGDLERFLYEIFIDFSVVFRCPDGYIGPRCDYKDLDGSYLGEFVEGS
jgi:hypothetical protein